LQGKFPGDGRKSGQEILKCIATLQILEHCLHRHSCPPEYGRSVHNFRVSHDRVRHVFIMPQTIVAETRYSDSQSLLIERTSLGADVTASPACRNRAVRTMRGSPLRRVSLEG
jgi:hypothetical protein